MTVHRRRAGAKRLGWRLGLALLPAPAAAAPTPTPSGEDAPSPAAPAVLAGEPTNYRPAHRTRLGSYVLEFPASAQWGAETAGGLPVDAAGESAERLAWQSAVLRVGARLDAETRLLPLVVKLEGEYDLFAGTLTGGHDPLLDDRLIRAEATRGTVRKAFARVGFAPFLTLAGGYTVSHWGLGLLANDGVQGRVLGREGLVSPGVGDRVLRAQIATGPWLGGKLLVTAAFDKVQDDDVTLPGDEGSQIVGAVVYGGESPQRLGVYAAHRTQTSRDGKDTDVTALDAHARGVLERGWGDLRGECEGAFIFGETDLGPTPEHPLHDVAQLGVAARIDVDARRVGVLTEIVHASGDASADDATQHAFRADPGFQVGSLLFSRVLAAQTARGADTAADPDLVGYPSQDLERVPTRGQVTNTTALAPSVYVRPTQGLTVFGGAVFAFSDAPLADPRESRLGGGTPHNALGGEPTRYLGTELSLGARHQALLFGTRITASAEAARFLPGDAFRDADGEDMGDVFGARLTLRLEL